MARPKNIPAAPDEDAVTFFGLVRMVRSTEDAKGGPVAAAVHPDEVHNYTAGGWQITGE